MINKRTILFRGKSLETDEWVYGYLIEQFDICDYPGITCFILELPDDINSTSKSIIEVDPDSVGQFTGYHDQNGAYLFEGDVIESDYRPIAQVHIVRKLIKDIRTCNLDKISKIEQRSVTKYTVIGNIYDNPELKDMCR